MWPVKKYNVFYQLNRIITVCLIIWLKNEYFDNILTWNLHWRTLSTIRMIYYKVKKKVVCYFLLPKFVLNMWWIWKSIVYFLCSTGSSRIHADESSQWYFSGMFSFDLLLRFYSHWSIDLWYIYINQLPGVA